MPEGTGTGVNELPAAPGSKADAPDTKPDAPAPLADSVCQLVDRTTGNTPRTLRLFALMLAPFSGLALVVLAAHGIHVSHGLLLPTGLFGVASSVIGLIATSVRRAARRRASGKGQPSKQLPAHCHEPDQMPQRQHLSLHTTERSGQSQ
jgi:hypothetical protein